MEPVERLEALLKQLDEDQPRLDKLHRYYRGRSDIPWVPQQASRELKQLVKIARTAWGGMIVDSVAERLVVDGIKSTITGMDEQAWRWWQANSLDARQTAIHIDALKCAASYVLVWPGTGGAAPTIRGLDARDTIGVLAGTDPAVLAEAVYRWTAGGVERATLYTPDAAYMFGRPTKGGTAVEVVRDWLDEPDTVDLGPSEEWVLLDEPEHELGACPIVRLANIPDLRGSGASDIEDHIPPIDRITETALGRLTAGKFGAYRQRWASGLQLGNRIDPQTGEPVLGPDGKPLPAGTPFQYGSDMIWVSEDPGSKFGDFAATDLLPIISALDQDIKHLAAVSRTPAHYLLAGTANPPSAEALLAAESGLTSKVNRRQLEFGEAWEHVIRLAAIAAGVPALAEDAGLEVVWKNTEVRSMGAVADALLKLRQAGIPLQVLLESLGHSPQSIQRTMGLVAAEKQAEAASQATAYGFTGQQAA
jgi:Phage portal protein, SPP1 Gp6-like